MPESYLALIFLHTLPNEITPASKTKIFVLDTNVLLHDPQCLHKFEDNTLAIPVEVLEELEKSRRSQGSSGRLG